MEGKGFNYQVKDFNKLRRMLRYLFVYGCYSREEAKLMGMSKRKYDDELRRIREFIDESNFVERYEKHKQVNLRFEYYENVENYLIETYYHKTFTRSGISYFFLILQILSEGDEPATIMEINRKINLLFGQDEEEDNLLQTIKRQVEKMADWDLINKDKKGSSNVYSLKRPFFSREDFTLDELIKLYRAVNFFSNINIPLVPGYYLTETLAEHLKYEYQVDVEKEGVFLFKHSSFHPILDEGIVWSLLWAISEQTKVRFTYLPKRGDGKMTVEAVPLRVVLDQRHGRWYLIAKANWEKLSVFSLEQVEEVKCLAEGFDRQKYDTEYEQKYKNLWTISPQEGEKNHHVRILFKEKYLYEKMVNKFGSEKIEEARGGGFILTLEVNSLTEIKPWLRSFGDKVQVLECPEHSLAAEMKEEWREMLANYGAIHRS